MTVQSSPFLRSQRNFPNDDLKSLSVENDRSYIDIASKVNDRTIGIYPTNISAITGEKWYPNGSNQSQGSLRQAYFFTSTNPINHGLDFTKLEYITNMYGQFYSAATNRWFGLIPASSTAIASQISFYLTSTQIVFVTGGVGTPVLSKGVIVIEWLAFV